MTIIPVLGSVDVVHQDQDWTLEANILAREAARSLSCTNGTIARLAELFRHTNTLTVNPRSGRSRVTTPRRCVTTCFTGGYLPLPVSIDLHFCSEVISRQMCYFRGAGLYCTFQDNIGIDIMKVVL